MLGRGGVEERVSRLLKTRNAAIAGAGQAESCDRAENCHPADYDSRPEYPARAHSQGLRDVNPPYQAPPSMPSGRTTAALYGQRLQRHHAPRPPAGRSFSSRYHIVAPPSPSGMPARSAGAGTSRSASSEAVIRPLIHGGLGQAAPPRAPISPWTIWPPPGEPRSRAPPLRLCSTRPPAGKVQPHPGTLPVRDRPTAATQPAILT